MLSELEQVAREMDDDTLLEGDLLDLATLAMGWACAALWREVDRCDVCLLSYLPPPY